MRQVVLLLCLIISSCIWAQSMVIDGLRYEVIKGNKVELLGSEVEVADTVRVPAEIVHNNRRYHVIRIATNAFMGADMVTIELPNSLRSIGSEAFLGCPKLSTIEIPNSVKEIEVEAFSCCSALQYIKLPERLKYIEYKLLFGCKSLKYLVIPNQVNHIYASAFADCSSLLRIELSSNTKSIGCEAFAECTKLREIWCRAERVPKIECPFPDNVSKYYIPKEKATEYIEKWNIDSKKVISLFKNPMVIR